MKKYILSAVLLLTSMASAQIASDTGGTASDFLAAFPAQGTAVGASDGTYMKPLLLDASGYLKINCVTGCGAGSGTTAINDGSITSQKLAIDAAGKIGINNFPSSYAVTGTFWQSTQPISHASLAAMQFDGSNYLKVILQNASLAVTGTFWQSIQPVSGTVTVNTISNFANETGGNLASIKTNTDKIPSLGQALAAASVPIVLTAAQLATLTPVSSVTATLNAETTKVIGTVNMAASQSIAVTQATPASLQATVTPAASTNWSSIQAQPARTTGTITTSSSAVTVATTGYGVATVTISGTYNSVTIGFFFSDDGGTTYYPTTCARTDTNLQVTSDGPLTNTNRAYDCGVFAATNFKVLASAWTSGTANIGITLSAAPIEPAPTVSVSGNAASTVADGANVVLGAKADAKSTATDTTAISIMQVLKEISAMEQAPASRAVTNAGTFAVQATMTSGNPCTTGTLLGVSGATSGTSSVQLVAISGSTKIYVCSAIFTAVSGTTPTVALRYGTGSACATGTVTMVGPSASLAAGTLFPTPPFQAVTPAGQALCYIQTGTTPVMNYNITYVQQ